MLAAMDPKQKLSALGQIIVNLERLKGVADLIDEPSLSYILGMGLEEARAAQTDAQSGPRLADGPREHHD